jgi:uncharacterized glyoxalase superfamily protein PhnB
MPGGDQIPADVKNRVMHVTLPVGDTFLMGSDTMPGYGKEFVQGNNSQIMINPKTRKRLIGFSPNFRQAAASKWVCRILFGEHISDRSLTSSVFVG